ncbi:hypothetical protein [Oxalicibacterium solurbis]|uniref:Uncharacterized protein n=1 Tax=Oxalicibacterium solurbis TaxID=69280 RepID=A0A8J3AU68_9BURK|nr:hypothetical protein [Oxalicibacterium solurbis]GGI53260.1 hypothetical protein GCM10011430_04340 [Oxalicibacterium solurbis]
MEFADLAVQGMRYCETGAGGNACMRRNGKTTRLSRMKSHVTLSFLDKAEIGYVNSVRPGGMAGTGLLGRRFSSKIADKK